MSENPYPSAHERIDALHQRVTDLETAVIEMAKDFQQFKRMFHELKYSGSDE